jgi:3-oxoacyl-[acyl-carrier protein] reductase
MEHNRTLEGKVAIVTGASRGIGLAIAEAMVAQGIHVVGAARTSEHVEHAISRVAEGAGSRERGGKHAGTFDVRVVDVREHAAVERFVNQVVAAFKGLDILVNNAGVGAFGEVAAQPVEEWHQTIETNLTGVFNCCHAAIPCLRRRGGGWIVNISSLASKNPFPGAAAYCASKAGLNAFSEALMQEVRYDGIRVSYVLPGSVRTEFGGTHSGPGSEWKLAPEDVASAVIGVLLHDPRSLPSRIEIRPSKPRK